MSFFKTNYEDIINYDVENGTYEVIIRSCFPDTTKSGTGFINMQMVIRNDIKQNFQNVYIFHKIWQNKTTLEFNSFDINKIAKCLHVPEGTEFKEMDNFLDYLMKKPLRVRVKKEETEYNGRKIWGLNVKEWYSTNFPDVNHIFKENKNEKTTTTLNDDDLPF